jgi:hypothetical protein
MEPSIGCIDGASIVPVPTNPMTAVSRGWPRASAATRARSLWALNDGGEVGLGSQLAGVQAPAEASRGFMPPNAAGVAGPHPTLSREGPALGWLWTAADHERLPIHLSLQAVPWEVERGWLC